MEMFHLSDFCSVQFILIVLSTALTASLSQTKRELQYLYFTRSNLTQQQMELWQKGRRCMTSEYHGNNTTNISYIFCPMIFEDQSFTECCGSLEKRRCCQSKGNSDIAKLLIGLVSGLVVIVAMVTTFICYCHSCRHCRHSNIKHKTTKQNKWRSTVNPIDRRLLLKTANYTVEQIWHQIVITFQNAEYFAKFGDILRRRHPSLRTRVPKMDRNSRTASIDQELCLYIDKDLHVVIVEGKEKTSWLNAAFQSICRNVRITESSEEMGISIPSLRPLSPRLPTTGEEYYLEGDYSVKLTTREIEIKFFSESLFTNFKRALLHKYPTMSWSKYLQRDCAIIKMENHKTVTLHLWEDICSLWFSGPGRRDWFNNEFHEIHKSATQEGVEVAYTEKRLMNGYEVEFISMDYVMTLKAFLERDYPSASWEKTRLCHVIKLEPTVGSPVTLYLPRSGSLERKIWIFKTPYCTAWYNQDFHKLLAEAESCLQRRKLTTNLPEECMTPVESSL